MRVSVWDRFWSKVVETPSGCWEWQAARDKDGYGRIGNGGRTFATHRIAYRWFKGPIPSWLQVDHGCRNRACVNPAHLELVTGQVNISRGETGQWIRERQLRLPFTRYRPTHCKRGHPLEGDNLIIRSDNGGRRCKTCQNERMRDWYRRNRAAKNAVA